MADSIFIYLLLDLRIVDQTIHREKSIVSGLPAAIGGTLELARTGELSSLIILILVILTVAVTAFVIFVERGQRRITVNYAKRQQGRKMVGGQQSHLPLKLNMAGVIPPIFAIEHYIVPGNSWRFCIKCRLQTLECVGRTEPW